MWAAPHPEPVRPSAGWYTVPALLLAAAALWCLVFVGLNLGSLRVADDPPASGDPASGVTVRLVRGHGYFLYAQRNAPAPTVCVVAAPDGMTGPVVLTRENAWSAGERPGLRYTATFEAPMTGTVRLACQDTEGQITVTPDDTVFGYLGLSVIGGAVAGAFAAVFWIVLFVRRSHAQRTPDTPTPHHL
ncbi:hypothetical protein GCM10009678_91930 [Actinomadura kijaniata]|uniref:Uncharacterized protein n=1 Tax=Actinomadura namibiensis TaxID=182080 RepID=A0A7W3QNP3_ACTNM|nr:hypothetical protein [Actinomadura namibiensis]MBA8953786.1 hypothetical protein [Actinomadura namibiensis]